MRGIAFLGRREIFTLWIRIQQRESRMMDGMAYHCLWAIQTVVRICFRAGLSTQCRSRVVYQGQCSSPNCSDLFPSQQCLLPSISSAAFRVFYSTQIHLVWMLVLCPKDPRCYNLGPCSCFRRDLCVRRSPVNYGIDRLNRTIEAMTAFTA
jgi:hypothetical protein